MAAPAVGTPGTGATAVTGTTLSVPLPSGWAAGDIVVVCAMHESAATLSISSGWTAIITPESNSGISTGFWWRRMVGGDSAPTVTSSVTLTSTNHAAARTYLITGCITSGDPFEDATATAVGDVVSPVTAAIDTTGPDRLAAAFLVADDDQGWATAPPPSGWTREANPYVSATGDDVTIELIYKTVASASTVASVTYGSWTDATGENTKVVTLAFVPPSATAYSIDAQPGSFAVTGTDATLARGRFADAQPGTFAVTGFVADLVHTTVGAYSMDAQPGSFAVTGAAATPARGLFFNAEPGAYTVTGVAAQFVHGGMFPAFISGDGTTDGAGASSEAASYVGPFIDANGNLYVFTEDDATTFKAAARKSTDGGITWTEADSSNKPNLVDLESTWVVQDAPNEILYILRQRSSSASVAFSSFRTSDHSTNPDTWVGGTGGAISVSSASTIPDDQSVSLVRRSDGDLIAFYRTDPSGSDQRIGYRISTNNGASWGSQSILDSTAGKSHTQVQAVVGESDVTHIFYANVTDATIMHKTLSASDVLSSSQVVSDNAVQLATTVNDTNPMANRVVYIDDGGTERVFVAWIRASTDLLVGCELVNGTPSAEEVISDATVYFSPTNQGSSQVVAALAYDGTTVYAVYADASTHDLWLATRTAGTWGTDVEIQDAVDAMQITANVYTHSAGNGGQKVVGVVFANDSGVSSGDLSYYTESAILASYSLDAQPGTYAITGTAATTARGLVVDAQPGAYVVSGVAAIVALGRFISADPGAYTLSGVAADLVHTTVGAFSLDAQPGAVAVTGTAATPVSTRVVNAAPGTYAVTGVAADLVQTTVGAYSVNAEPGSYTVTGTAASVVSVRFVNAAPTTYAVSGSAATPELVRTVNAAAGAYTVTGTAATLLPVRFTNASPGAYALSGAAATLNYAGAVVPGSATVTDAPTASTTVRDMATATVSATDGGAHVTVADIPG